MWEGSERQTQQVASDLFLFKWLQSLCAQCVPIDTLARLWDRFLYEGTGFLFRTALAILRLLQPVIEKMPLEDTIALLTCNVRMKRVWNETVSRDALFAAINRIVDGYNLSHDLEAKKLAACELLKTHGYEHYEISNWAKKGFEWAGELYKAKGGVTV